VSVADISGASLVETLERVSGRLDRRRWSVCRTRTGPP